MKTICAVFLITVLLGRCTQTTVQSAATLPSTDDLIIRTGTSFGMCAGYCRTDYVFNGTSTTLTQNANRTQSQNPPKTCQNPLSQADWNALRALANYDAFARQPATLGCPDCADGGAEYIELQAGDRTHRVTFEYNQTIPGFEPLVDALRKQRNAFKACP